MYISTFSFSLRIGSVSPGGELYSYIYVLKALVVNAGLVQHSWSPPGWVVHEYLLKCIFIYIWLALQMFIGSIIYPTLLKSSMPGLGVGPLLFCHVCSSSIQWSCPDHLSSRSPWWMPVIPLFHCVYSFSWCQPGECCFWCLGSLPMAYIGR